MITLGIDIGTTTLKVCLVKDAAPIEWHSVAHHAQKISAKCEYSEQDPYIILRALDGCLRELKQIEEVTKIAVTGQMHGVLLWEHSNTYRHGEIAEVLTLYKRSVVKTTNLITWQDQRCDGMFLNSLSCKYLSAGYGLATLMWLKQHDEDYLKQFNRCGTIMDFIVWLFTLPTRVLMTSHNANGWGYFDQPSNSWQKEMLSKDSFDVDLLPVIVPVGSVAGGLRHSIYGMHRSRVTVFAGFGDHQCSVRAHDTKPHQAVLNIGTSSQLSFVLPSHCLNFIKEGYPKLSVVPYDGGHVVVAVASLNAGNVFQHFVSFLRNLCTDVGCANVPSAEQLLEKLNSLPRPTNRQTLNIKPTLYGERHSPSQLGVVADISPSCLSLAHITHSLVDGIIDNLFSMLPVELLHSQGVSTLLLTGGCLLRNKLFQESLQRSLMHFDLRLVDANKDCAYGAAMFVEHS